LKKRKDKKDIDEKRENEEESIKSRSKDVLQLKDLRVDQ